MSKTKTLYWTLKRSWYAGGFEVMRVTTEKKNQVYGTVDGEGTHCAIAQTEGKFDTEEAAQEVVGRVTEVRKNYSDLLNTMSNARNLAEASERAAIEAAVKGMDPGLVPEPFTLISKAQVMPKRLR